jgi:hypothetical protein
MCVGRHDILNLSAAGSRTYAPSADKSANKHFFFVSSYTPLNNARVRKTKPARCRIRARHMSSIVNLPHAQSRRLITSANCGCSVYPLGQN